MERGPLTFHRHCKLNFVFMQLFVNYFFGRQKMFFDNRSIMQISINTYKKTVGVAKYELN